MALDTLATTPALPPQHAPPAKQWRPSDDDHEHENVCSSTISALFSDAAQYGQVIADCASGLSDSDSSGSQTQASRPTDFAALVGGDLTPAEKFQAGRFANITAEDSDWSAPDEGHFAAEPESLAGSEESSSSEGHDSDITAVHTDESATSTLATAEAAEILLSPEQIVHILEEEFGQLAPEGEEKLLFFKDGAIIQDVSILGVVHVTTHRVAFHASMPAFDTNQSNPNEIIRSGPALVHRKGFHRKKRIWLELSNDFMSSFPSAREEDHIRPWRSVMLNSILEIIKEDPKHPRVMAIRLDGKSGVKDCELEFDNVESAREWRRELQAALFFNRRRMSKFISDPDDVSGVRIGVPFENILGYTRHMHAETLPILTVTVSTGIADKLNASDTDVREGTQSLQVAFHYMDAHWDEMEELVRLGQARKLARAASADPTRVVIDFGVEDGPSIPRVFSHDDEEVLDARSREQVICDWLAIDYTPDVWITRASLSIGLACTGFLVVSRMWIGFWSKSLTLRDVKYRLNVASVHRATPSDTMLRTFPRLRHGLILEIEGQANLRFSFRTTAARDETMNRVNVAVSGRAIRPRSPVSPKGLRIRPLPLSSRSASPALVVSPTSFSRPRSLTPSPTRSESDSESRGPRTSSSSSSGATLFTPLGHNFKRICSAIDPRQVLQFPKAVNIPADSLMTLPPKRFTCLTIGSRGDVQPYIALGLGLKRQGHTVTIVTHEEYKAWVVGFGLNHRSAGGDPGALMKLSVENKMFSPQFFKTSLTTYRKWLDQLLIDAWENCQDAEVLLESPYAMAGVHISEALKIPYFRVCTMPWTKTTEFPHPFISAPVETPTFNSISYVLFDNIFWTATSSQVNRWRRESLHLGPTVMSHVPQSKIPLLYNFSPAVVPKPLDWSDSKVVCGYWFLDNPDLDWAPPESLIKFMEKARSDGKPLVYIGFGSITVPDPRLVTEHVVEAVVKSGVRAIVSRGWSSRMSRLSKGESDVVIPEECYMVDKVPHDWLFPQIDAALHHGGAGTTGASLRAGIPTLIKPWFGDQYFWASRVQRLGAGLRVPSLKVSDLAAALTRATTDRIMKEKAAAVGHKIWAENGVREALRAIYTYLPRASSEGISPE